MNHTYNPLKLLGSYIGIAVFALPYLLIPYKGCDWKSCYTKTNLSALLGISPSGFLGPVYDWMEFIVIIVAGLISGYLIHLLVNYIRSKKR